MTIKEKIIQKAKVSEINIDPNYATIVRAIKNKSKYYQQMTKELGYLGLPLCYLVAKKMYVIAGMEDIEAAKANGIDEIEVEIRVISEADRLKYLSVTILYKLKEYEAISIYIEILENYFKTPDGILWLSSLPKDRKERLAEITGLSQTTIQRYISVGDQYRYKLIDVQNGEMTWNELTEFVDRLKNPSKYKNEYDSIEKEKAAEEARKKAEKATKDKLAAEKAEKERKETAAALAITGSNTGTTVPIVLANKNAASTPVPDSTNRSNEGDESDNAPIVEVEQIIIEVIPNYQLTSASLVLDGGVKISFEGEQLIIDGKKIQGSLSNEVSGSVQSSIFSIAGHPEVKFRITIENYDVLKRMVND